MILTDEFAPFGCSVVTWKNDKVRELIKKADPTFYKLINQLAPDDTYKIYYARYSFAQSAGDIEQVHLPIDYARTIGLRDIKTASIKQDLGYGELSSPMGMVLENEFEYYSDVHIEKRSQNIDFVYPHRIIGPGAVFPMTGLFSNTFTPNSMLSIAAGRRTSFILPTILDKKGILSLQDETGKKLSFPENIKYHNDFFRAICVSSSYKSNWHASIAYFSENWVTALLHDPAWSELRTYLLHQFWSRTEYMRRESIYNFSLASVANYKSTKINPFIFECVQKLFRIAVGVDLAYAPATCPTLQPVNLIQKALCEHFDTGNELPTIMQSMYYNMDLATSPVFFSLQHPLMMNMSLNTRRKQTILTELRELFDVLEWLKYLVYENERFENTIYQAMAQATKFTPIHYQEVQYENTHKFMTTEDLFKVDKRFSRYNCHAANYFRGCMMISRHERNSPSLAV